jgi:hypothetical protein
MTIAVGFVCSDGVVLCVDGRNLFCTNRLLDATSKFATIHYSEHLEQGTESPFSAFIESVPPRPGEQNRLKHLGKVGKT